MKMARWAVAVAVAGASVLAVAPGDAQAAAPLSASLAATCQYRAITGSGNMSDSPTSTKAGQKLVTSTTVRDTKALPLWGVFFDYEMVAMNSHKGAAPLVWWRFGGSWHQMPMSWQPATKENLAEWIGGDAVLGGITGHTTGTLEMTIEYPSGVEPGYYDGLVMVGAKTCGPLMLGAFPVSTSYQPR